MNPDKPFDLVFWMRPHDDAIFGNLQQEGLPVSHRFGPFKDPQEAKDFFMNQPADALERDCGPIMPQMEIKKMGSKLI